MNPLRTADDPVVNTWFHRIRVVLATVGGLFGTYLAIVATVALPRIPVESDLLLYKITTWFYLASHSISFTIRDPVTSAEYPLRIGSIPGWHGLLYLLPPLALFVAGYWTARRAHRPEDRGFLEGMKLAGVYLPIMFAFGLFSYYLGELPVTRGEISNGAVTTDMAGVVIVAGIVYPVVFAGIGGALPPTVDGYLDRKTGGPLHRLDQLLGED